MAGRSWLIQKWAARSPTGRGSDACSQRVPRTRRKPPRRMRSAGAQLPAESCARARAGEAAGGGGGGVWIRRARGVRPRLLGARGDARVFPMMSLAQWKPSGAVLAPSAMSRAISSDASSPGKRSLNRHVATAPRSRAPYLGRAAEGQKHISAGRSMAMACNDRTARLMVFPHIVPGRVRF